MSRLLVYVLGVERGRFYLHGDRRFTCALDVKALARMMRRAKYDPRAMGKIMMFSSTINWPYGAKGRPISYARVQRIIGQAIALLLPKS